METISINRKTVEMAKDIRFQLDELYADLLIVDSFQRGTSMSLQANSLLSAELQEREKRIIARNRYLAWLRGVTPSNLWLDVKTGEAKAITDSELKALREQGLIDESGEVPGLGE
jgi:hypothetical protein